MIQRRTTSSFVSVMPAPHVNRRPLIRSADKPAMNLIVDSGAFSAWKLKKPVPLDEYCDYLLANLPWIEHYINLDVINPQNPEEAARASFENLLYMRKRGLKPMPVFHVGEHPDWLHRMLDLGIDYVGLSASSLVSRNQVDDWYAYAWSQLVDSKGFPTVKAHAFGEGRYESLRKFPWMSADSTSWIYTSELTGTFRLTDGRRVAMRNDGVSSANARDIEQLDAMDYEAFRSFARAEGIHDMSVFHNRDTIGGVLRLYMTAAFYREQTKTVNKLCPIRFNTNSLFDTVALHQTRPSVAIPAMNFYLVLGGSSRVPPVCAYAKTTHALASYFHIRSVASYRELEHYVYDPMHVATTHKSFAQYAEILEKYVHAR